MEYGRYGISREDAIRYFGGEQHLLKIEQVLNDGYVIFTHPDADYAYIGEKGDNEGCLSYQVSLEYVVKENLYLQY